MHNLKNRKMKDKMMALVLKNFRRDEEMNLMRRLIKSKRKNKRLY
jgi:hypothetical protein